MRLLRPSPIPEYLLNGTPAKVKQVGGLLLRHALAAQVDNCSLYVVGEICRRDSTSSARLSFFNILCLGSNLQVSRIYAEGNVALMANYEPCGDRRTENLVGGSMRALHLSIQLKRPIPVSRLPSCPDQTVSEVFCRRNLVAIGLMVGTIATEIS
jgi:hypothetical protein